MWNKLNNKKISLGQHDKENINCFNNKFIFVYFPMLFANIVSADIYIKKKCGQKY